MASGHLAWAFGTTASVKKGGSGEGGRGWTDRDWVVSTGRGRSRQNSEFLLISLLFLYWFPAFFISERLSSSTWPCFFFLCSIVVMVDGCALVFCGLAGLGEGLFGFDG
jgi:hypothetical protein